MIDRGGSIPSQQAEPAQAVQFSESAVRFSRRAALLLSRASLGAAGAARAAGSALYRIHAFVE